MKPEMSIIKIKEENTKEDLIEALNEIIADLATTPGLQYRAHMILDITNVDYEDIQ